MQNRSREILAGITTFFTMAYIVVVNPSILSATGMPASGVLTATVLLCFAMTLLMGVYAKLPFGVAPGMGINAFFAFSIVLGKHVPWQTALGSVFWAGVLFLLISLTPIRVMIAQAIPHSIRVATATGIGIFLTFIGLKGAGIIAADPVTFVKLGALDAKAGAAFAGFLVAVFLLQKKSPLAFLGAILTATAIGIAAGHVRAPETFIAAPDFGSVFFKLDLWGALKLSLLPATISIVFTDLFDSISTLVGVSHATGLLDEHGAPKNLREGLIVDAWATLTAGLLGTSPGTAYIESAAGVEAGGRTGLTSVVTAFCFLPCLFLAPLAGMIPAFATAPVLVIVGGLMFKSVSQLKLEKLEDALPAFLTVVLIPLTFSITQGLLWGFITHTLLYLIAGRRRELSASVLVLTFVSAALLILEKSSS